MIGPGEYERGLVREAARRFMKERCSSATLRAHIEDRTLGDFVRATWAEVAELGWPSILMAEPGDHSVDTERALMLSAVAEELGAALYPGPVLSSAVVGHAIANRGSAALQAEYLDRIYTGDIAAAIAVHAVPGVGDAPLVAKRTRDGVALTGVVPAVPDAAEAAVFLVAAGSDADRVHLVVPAGSAGLRVRQLDSLDLTRRFARLEFTDTVVADYAVLAGGAKENRATEDLMTLLSCSQSIGAAARTFEFTLQYAKTRIAFGRPIGAFQVIKHRLVDMLLMLESAKAAVDMGLANLGSKSAFGCHGAAIAKLYTSRTLPLLARDCLQVHGGIGFTWEHDMHLYLRRIESDAVLWGAPDELTDRLAASLGLARDRDRQAEVVA